MFTSSPSIKLCNFCQSLKCFFIAFFVFYSSKEPIIYSLRISTPSVLNHMLSLRPAPTPTVERSTNFPNKVLGQERINEGIGHAVEEIGPYNQVADHCPLPTISGHGLGFQGLERHHDQVRQEGHNVDQGYEEQNQCGAADTWANTVQTRNDKNYSELSD